jgi:hypothetical protein
MAQSKLDTLQVTLHEDIRYAENDEEKLIIILPLQKYSYLLLQVLENYGKQVSN